MSVDASKDCLAYVVGILCAFWKIILLLQWATKFLFSGKLAIVIFVPLYFKSAATMVGLTIETTWAKFNFATFAGIGVAQSRNFLELGAPKNILYPRALSRNLKMSPRTISERKLGARGSRGCAHNFRCRMKNETRNRGFAKSDNFRIYIFWRPVVARAHKSQSRSAEERDKVNQSEDNRGGFHAEGRNLDHNGDVYRMNKGRNTLCRMSCVKWIRRTMCRPIVTSRNHITL